MQNRTIYGLISFSIISLILAVFGLEFFTSIWSFPGNFEIFKNFPSENLPLGLVPFMVIALIGTGVFITFRLGFPQVRYVWHGIRVTSGKYDNPKDKGDLSHFKALSTAISATVGIGNIAGVATAIYYGGPGALFWMWISAFFGTALKFAESTLAVEYRSYNSNGETAGGPMYTIEKGLGKNWKWLAIAFASFAIICSFATGNAIQSFTVSDQIYHEFSQILGTQHFLTLKYAVFQGFSVSILQIINGIVLAFLVGIVIIGGIKRIGDVSGFLAPFMGIIYTATGLLILLYNYETLLPSFGIIIDYAFNPPAQIAGTIGGLFLVFMNSMLWGIKRGLYSNESGQGSAAVAHSTAKTEFAVREGVVALLEPFIDTIIICTITGLVIISTGAWQHTQFYLNHFDPNFSGEIMNSSILTSYAFKIGLAWLFPYGDKIVTLSVLLFAVSTAISWSFYGDRATDYLFGEKAIIYYKYVFILFVFLGAISQLEIVWDFGDAALGFMTLPNLLAIILLSGKLKKMTKDYFSIKHLTYKEQLLQNNGDKNV